MLEEGESHLCNSWSVDHTVLYGQIHVTMNSTNLNHWLSNECIKMGRKCCGRTVGDLYSDDS